MCGGCMQRYLNQPASGPPLTSETVIGTSKGVIKASSLASRNEPFVPTPEETPESFKSTPPVSGNAGPENKPEK